MSFDEELAAYIDGKKNSRKETCKFIPIKTIQQDDRSLREICRDAAARHDPHEWF